MKNVAMPFVAWMCLAAPLAAGEPETVDFDTHIMPIFTRAGCNAGACHGAAIGRGGFKLSLYGSNPVADHRELVQALEGRRVNLAEPESSLVVLKPTGELDHGGGLRFEADSAAAVRLQRWVEQGAPRTADRSLVEFLPEPRRQWLSEGPGTVHFAAQAVFSDGTREDVTEWTVFTPEDAHAVQWEEGGRAAVHRPGRHVVVARFLDRVVPLEILVAYPGEPTAATLPRANFVDDHINERLQALGIPASPRCNDETFVRRLYLDLSGRLPSPAEVGTFVRSTDPDKRAQLVDRLLADDAFVDYWAYQLGTLLRVRPVGRGNDRDSMGASVFHEWIREQLAADTPFDQLARALITASGDAHLEGPPNFYRGAQGAREQAEFVSELFMGARLRCANCHDHPLDRWTQDDYHGLAAVFARLETGRVVRETARGEVTHPATGEPARPRIPGDRFLDVEPEGMPSGREALADWLVTPDNPYFARAMVNRFWKALMGRGLIEPTDDLRVTNLATHPELLDELAHDFATHGFRLRRTLRHIALSEAYQRAARPLESASLDDRFYGHALTRPLPAEVLADAIADVTAVADDYNGFEPGTRAIELFDPSVPSRSLDVLGRCLREESCEGPGGSAADSGVARQLHLLNGPLLNEKITHASGRLRGLLDAGHSPEEIVVAFYGLALCRPPSPRESDFWQEQMAAASGPNERQACLEDFLWSLLASDEFTTNH